MTPVELATYVRLKTRTNSSTFTDSDLLVLANIVKNQVCDRALEVDEDIFLVPSYMNLVADQREYPLYSHMLSRIKRVEAKLDGTNWLKLDEIDLGTTDFPISSETLITSRFGNEEGRAKFDIMRNSLWLYTGTITSVEDGLRVWLNTRPVNIASLESNNDMSLDPSTTTHGIPSALHKVIATGIIIEWKESRSKPIPLTEREMKWEFDLEKGIQTLKKANYDRELVGEIPDEDGFNY
jgi:hypothetical protein